MRKLLILFLIVSLMTIPLITADEGAGEESGVHIMFGAITIIFGIVAIVWTYSAKRTLAAGSSLRQYTSNFLIALFFIVGANVWHLIREVTNVAAAMGSAAEYPEYFLYILAFLVFVLAAYQMKFVSQEFNFEDQATDMKQALDKGKK